MKLLHVIIFLFFSLTVFHVTGAAAGNRAGAVSVSPLIGGYIFDSDQLIKNDAAYGIVLGYNITERIGIEGAFNYVGTEVRLSNLSNSVGAYVYRLEGLYHFMVDKNVLPYIAAGAGAIRIDVDGIGDDTAFLFNYGAGIKYFLTEPLALRAGVRHIIFSEDTHHNFLFKLGLSYYFGVKPKKAAPDPMPKDGDGDGVNDSEDQCTGTPRGIAVDEKGCPLVSDSDGDGVSDDQDTCSRTPSGASVDASGCPLDSDKDGVYDYKDTCPGTAAGINVDAAGCPLPIKEKVSIQLHVSFASNSAVVKNTFHEDIEKVSNFLKTYPETIAVIEGHTDSAGNDEDNLKLSQQRAENVMRHFVDYGIHPSRLKAEGYGESRPIADNSTAEGRQKNRRVNAVISRTILRKPVIEQEERRMIDENELLNKNKETQTIDDKSVIKETSDNIIDEENKLNGKLKVDDQIASQLVYTIQTGSYTIKAHAEKQVNFLLQSLNKKDLDFLRIEKTGKYYTVRLGKFENYAAAKKFIQEVKLGLPEAVILKAVIKNERIIRWYE